MRFEGREINELIEPVAADDLREAGVYFQLKDFDSDCFLLEVTPWVYLGRDLDEEDDGVLYFQDACSHRDGVRMSDRTRRDEVTFQLARVESQNVMYEFEKALEQLMWCSTRRRKHEPYVEGSRSRD